MNFDSNDYCVDCDVDTLLIGEYYMVKSEVWALTGLGPHDGMLCITCLENRIDRQLTSKDFSDYPVNSIPKMFRSDKLKSRLNNRGL